MLLFLTRANVASPSALKLTKVPKRFLSLGVRVFPRKMFSALFWRVVFEIPVARYALALSPVPVALVLKPEWALPISLAPVPMALFVILIESYVLNVPSPAARRALISPVEQDRGLDLLKIRAEQVLTRLGAARHPGTGVLHLVIEQSEILRVAPLTYVSIQPDGPEPDFLSLTEDEQTMIAEALFDAAFDEARLRLINAAQNQFVRTYVLDPNSISAHARLAALARSQG
ncbi:MAG: hypothetical protein AAFV19_22335 [Pseudomonadota bacterium]